jgi:hypothetical protein
MKLTELSHRQSIETVQEGTYLKHWLMYGAKCELDDSDSVSKGFIILENEVEAACKRKLGDKPFVVTQTSHEINGIEQPTGTLEERFKWSIQKL